MVQNARIYFLTVWVYEKIDIVMHFRISWWKLCVLLKDSA